MPSAPDRSLRLPIVCYVTDSGSLATPDVAENLGGRSFSSDVKAPAERGAFAGSASARFLAEAHEELPLNLLRLLGCIRNTVAAGVDWIQIREKNLPARELLALVREAVRIAQSDSNCRVIVNGRLDVALAANAHGLHLGGDALPASEAISWLKRRNAPEGFLMGISCHSLEDAKQAEAAGASYIFFGPIFQTPAKLQFGAPQGVDRLAEVCRAMQIPVIAIGGINPNNYKRCLDAGAAGIAAIHAFQNGQNPDALRNFISNAHNTKRA